MRYVKDWSGLDPSEYAGGGSASSSLHDGPALVSRGRARLVSSWRERPALDGPGTTCWSDGAYAGAALDDSADAARVSASETEALYGSQGSSTANAAADWSGEGASVKSEENGGGGRKGELLAEASDAGYCGGGGCCRRCKSSGRSTSAPERNAAARVTSSVKRASSLSLRTAGSPASSPTLRRLGKTGREEEEGEDAASRGGDNLAIWLRSPTFPRTRLDSVAGGAGRTKAQVNRDVPR